MKLGIITTSAIITTTQIQVLDIPLILRLRTKKPTDIISTRKWVALGLNKQPPFLLLQNLRTRVLFFCIAPGTCARPGISVNRQLQQIFNQIFVQFDYLTFPTTCAIIYTQGKERGLPSRSAFQGEDGTPSKTPRLNAETISLPKNSRCLSSYAAPIGTQEGCEQRVFSKKFEKTLDKQH